MTHTKKIAAVILAAGGSTRFGSPKQLAQWRGKTFLAHVVDTALASSVAGVWVVLGASASACQRELAARPVEIVLNPAWAQGQSTSLKAGLAALPSDISAALFPLVDQPLVKVTTLTALMERYQHTHAPLVWPEYEGQRGNPVLFDRSLFPEMAQVTGDTGARPILKRHHTHAERVAVPDAGVLKDFDHPADLTTLSDSQP